MIVKIEMKAEPEPKVIKVTAQKEKSTKTPCCDDKGQGCRYAIAESTEELQA